MLSRGMKELKIHARVQERSEKLVMQGQDSRELRVSKWGPMRVHSLTYSVVWHRLWHRIQAALPQLIVQPTRLEQLIVRILTETLWLA